MDITHVIFSTQLTFAADSAMLLPAKNMDVLKTPCMGQNLASRCFLVQRACWIHVTQRAARQRDAFCLLTGSVEDLPGPVALAVVHILIIISLLLLCTTDSDF